MNQDRKPDKSRTRRAPAILALTLSILLVPLLLVATEGLLRLGGYGVPTAPFRAVEHTPTLYRDNPHYFRKYYPRTEKSDQDIYPHLFRREKDEQTVRGIVLGGSTAAGFPYRKKHGFPEAAAAILNGVQQAVRVEILNVGYSAMSSYYVRDLRGTIHDYDADFLVLYTGHNEFYGTTSVTTGGNRFLKNLYLTLKDYRVFQFLFNLTSSAPKGHTLMATQFAGQRIGLDDPRRAQARKDFLANIGDVLDQAVDEGIPVVILEPISNYRDMPPFGSPDASVSAKTLAAWHDETAREDYESALATARAHRSAHPDDPYGAYLVARTLDRQGDHREALPYYREAVEKDPIPFRMPPSMASALAEFVGSYPEHEVRYLPLERIALESEGPQFFSNQRFVDHLHFNFEGQKWVGQQLARAISEVVPALSPVTGLIDSLVAPPGRLESALGFLPIFELAATQEVRKLIAAPPYSTMPWPYQNPELARAWSRPPFAGQDRLNSRLQAAPTDDYLEIFLQHLTAAGKRNEVFSLLTAFVKINPGSAQSHLNIGQYLVVQPNQEAKRIALKEFINALALDDDPDGLYDSLRAFLMNNRQAEFLAALTRQWRQSDR